MLFKKSCGNQVFMLGYRTTSSAGTLEAGEQSKHYESCLRILYLLVSW